MSNGEDGVAIFKGAQSNTIGGSMTLANSIRFNNIGNGVGVYGNATTGNTIRFNSIDRKNQGLGIDLGGDGVTPNHGDTAATGPNNLENYPSHHVGRLRNDDDGRRFVRQSAQRHLHDRLLCEPRFRSVRLRRRQPLARLSLGDDGRKWPGHSTDDVQPPDEPGNWIHGSRRQLPIRQEILPNSRTAWQLTALASQVTVTPSITSPTYGQSLTFTATIAPFGSGLATPTGTIQFQVDGSSYGSAVTLVNGAATSISTATLAAGHVTRISAVYSGDLTYTTVTGTTSQTTSHAPLTITADDKSKVYGNKLTFAGTEFTESGLVNGDTVTGTT